MRRREQPESRSRGSGKRQAIVKTRWQVCLIRAHALCPLLSSVSLMDRRALLKTGSFALAGLGLGACATTNRKSSSAPRRAPINLAPVHASWDRVLRTTVGLRPHRDSGFVLRAEKLDAKTLIHDYGHAGAGMSLAWGCAVMVAEFAQATGERRAAVLGCGSPG